MWASLGECMVKGEKRYRILSLLQTRGTGGAERLVRTSRGLLIDILFLPLVGSLTEETLQKAFRNKGH